MPYGDRPHFKYTRVEQNFHSLVGEELSTKDIIPDPKHSAEPIENVSLFLLDFSYKGDRLYQSNAELEFEIVHNNSWKIDKYDPPSAFKHLFSNSGERK